MDFIIDQHMKTARLALETARMRLVKMLDQTFGVESNRGKLLVSPSVMMEARGRMMNKLAMVRIMASKA